MQFTYDGAHRLTEIQDGTGNSIQYSLDAMGNRTAESAYDPSNVLSRTRSQIYNALSELYQQVGSAGTSAVTTTYGYDSNGNRTSIQAPLSLDSGNVYDALNRLIQVTDPNSGVSTFNYDANDDLISVKDPATLTTSYQYDGLGDVLQLVSPATGTTTNTYDLARNLAGTTDARGVGAAYSYDAANRVTQMAYGDQTIVLTYDAGTNGKGRLTGAHDASHSMSWQYDALGRVTSKSQTLGIVTKSVGYAYSNADLITLTTPSGQAVAYSYSNHQITGISINGTTLVTGVKYDPFGPTRGWSWGHGTSEIRLRDTDGNPNLISGIESTSYTVDSAFRIVGVANASNAGLSCLDRLTAASNPAGALTWSYDADGNRLSQSGAAGPSYGATGLSMIYNNRGRMVNVTGTNTTTTTYLYNALGQRIEKSGASIILFWYDEAGHLLGEYTSNGTLLEETVWLGDLPVATLQPNGSGGINVYYIHADHLNSPKTITRSTDNAIMWRWDQDPFGTAAPNQNPSSQGTLVYNLRFPGQYFDAETGLIYNYYRDLDPNTGRYVESDPIGLKAGSWSTYAYANGGPISQRDPNGLEAVAAMSRLGWGLPPPPPIPAGCGCSPRLPDFATFQFDIYVASFTGTYTNNGDVFFGKGVSRGYNNPVGIGASISAGWLLNCNPTVSDINNFLMGWSGSVGYYDAFGAAYSANTSGQAVLVGVGASASLINGAPPSVGGVSPGIVNSYQGNIFGQ